MKTANPHIAVQRRVIPAHLGNGGSLAAVPEGEEKHPYQHGFHALRGTAVRVIRMDKERMIAKTVCPVLGSDLSAGKKNSEQTTE
jgi:hypothetical protein